MNIGKKGKDGENETEWPKSGEQKKSRQDYSIIFLLNVDSFLADLISY